MKRNNNETNGYQRRRHLFLECFLNPGIRKISILFGTVFGIATALVGILFHMSAGWALGLVTGAVSALLLSVTLTLMLWREETRYDRIISAIPGQVLDVYEVLLAVRGGRQAGRIVLTADSIILLSLSRGNHRMELTRRDVRTIGTQGDGRNILIFLDETRYISVYPLEPEKLFRRLSDEGWADIRRDV